MSTLIVFSTYYGATEKVSKMLEKKINGDIEVHNLQNIKNLNLNSFNNIIIGASVKMGQIQKGMKNWLASEKDLLLKKNLYFFLCAGEENANKRNEFWRRNYPKELLDSCKIKIWAGSEVNFDKMGFIEKLMVKKFMGKNSSSSDLQLKEIDSLVNLINA